MRFSGFSVSFRPVAPASLPPYVDLRAGFPPVTNQTYNSCVAESLTAAYAYAALKQLGPAHQESSRLFLYYQARAADGMETQDAGAYIGSGAYSLTSTGISEEIYHPYSAGPFVKPNKSAYADALDHKAVEIKMVDQEITVIKDLLSRGYPVTIGFLVFPSIQSATVERTGDIPMPSTAERRAQPLGGHAVVLVGYDDAAQKFLLRNSWGTQWGVNGYGSLPYAYLLDSYLSQDFWVILSVDDDSIKDTPVPTPPPTPTPTPVPTPPPQPCPCPPPTPAPPTPVPYVECCTSCPPDYCCCARTRLAARNRGVQQRAQAAAQSPEARMYQVQQQLTAPLPFVPFASPWYPQRYFA